jgi:hypothetical protein
MSGTKNSVDGAIALATMGFHVFPVIENDKKPAIKGFPTRASRHTSEVHELFSETRARYGGHNYNIGISTSAFGDNKALMVIDVDKKDGRDGFESLAMLDLCGFHLPDTLQAGTPSGGVHHIFYVDQPVKQGTDVLGVGLDIRSKGGYIVAPPSTIDGREYVFLNELPVAKAPDWAVERCGFYTAPLATVSLAKDYDVDQGRAVVQAVKYLRTIPVIEQGSRDSECFKIAARLKDIGLKRPTMIELLNDTPVFNPPLSPLEIEQVVNHVFEYGQNNPGSMSLEAQFGKPEEPRSRIKIARDIKIKKAVPALIEGLLNPGGFSALLGVPGTKKSFMALEMAFSIATGRDCLGHKVAQGGVLYMALEGLDGFEKRVAGLQAHHGLNDFPLAISGESLNLSQSDSKDGTKLLELIQEAEASLGQPIKFLVLDTLNRIMAGADENSTRDMTLLVGRLDHIRKQTGVHILVVHHLGKDASKGARGSSVLVGAVDTELRIVNDTLRITKQKDMEVGPKTPFRLQTIEIFDDEDTSIKTAVLVGLTDAQVAFSKKPIPAGSKQDRLFDILGPLATAPIPPELRPPFVDQGQLAVHLDIVKDAFDEPEASKASNRMSFKRALDWLIENGHVNRVDDWVWVVKRE